MIINLYLLICQKAHQRKYTSSDSAITFTSTSLIRLCVWLASSRRVFLAAAGDARARPAVALTRACVLVQALLQLFLRPVVRFAARMPAPARCRGSEQGPGAPRPGRRATWPRWPGRRASATWPRQAPASSAASCAASARWPKKMLAKDDMMTCTSP